MNYKNLYKNILLIVFVLGLGLTVYSNNVAAFSRNRIDLDEMRPFRINAVVYDINLQEKYLIVGEQKIYLIEFKFGSNEYRSAFVDERGNTSYVDSLITSRWKGERVLVKGFKLTNGDVVAESIKRIRSRRY